MNSDERRVFLANCGATRKGNILRIRASLLNKGLTVASLSRIIGVSAPAVCRVLQGRGHSPRILDALLRAGVPAKYLSDPRQVARNER